MDIKHFVTLLSTSGNPRIEEQTRSRVILFLKGFGIFVPQFRQIDLLYFN